MADLHVSAAAEADLDSAYAYLEARNPTAADAFVEAFWAGARLHAAQPRLGRPRGDFRPGLRSFVVGRYVVFFRPDGDGVEIVRVLHGSRDARAELAGDETED